MTLRGKRLKTSLFCKFSYWIINYVKILLSSVFRCQSTSWNKIHIQIYSIVLILHCRNWNHSSKIYQIVHAEIGTQLWAEQNSVTTTWAVSWHKSSYSHYKSKNAFIEYLLWRISRTQGPVMWQYIFVVR